MNEENETPTPERLREEPNMLTRFRDRMERNRDNAKLKEAIHIVLIVATFILAVLKAQHVLHISWLIVLSPIWGIYALVIAVLLLASLIALILMGIMDIIAMLM